MIVLLIAIYYFLAPICQVPICYFFVVLFCYRSSNRFLFSFHLPFTFFFQLSWIELLWVVVSVHLLWWAKMCSWKILVVIFFFSQPASSTNDSWFLLPRRASDAKISCSKLKGNLLLFICLLLFPSVDTDLVVVVLWCSLEGQLATTWHRLPFCLFAHLYFGDHPRPRQTLFWEDLIISQQLVGRWAKLSIRLILRFLTIV